MGRCSGTDWSRTAQDRTAQDRTAWSDAQARTAQALSAGGGEQRLEPSRCLFLPNGLRLDARGPAHGRGERLDAVIGRCQYTF